MEEFAPNWLRPGSEPQLEDILADPMLLALLACDKLTVDEVRSFAICARTRLSDPLRH